MHPEVAIERVVAQAYRVPTDSPEADGTYAWSSTTLVVVHVDAGAWRGLGYSYGSAAMVPLIHEQLAPKVRGLDALAVEQAWGVMQREVRNVGRAGVAATAISAVDAALWDLKAKVLDLPLVSLLGQVRSAAPAYGSGGFTSYSLDRLQSQLAGWVERGLTAVKMKVGASPATDAARVQAARAAVGPKVELMVDANGAYSGKEALWHAHDFAEHQVRWFEEPVSSDDLAGLRAVRSHAPQMQVAAGEYGYDPVYFRRMLEAGAVDVLQADATRCLGITGFLAAARLCEAFGVPLSSHTAPALHVHPACAAAPLRHVEFFHDHVRIEAMLFDGGPSLKDGRLVPDLSRPGLGLELRPTDAERFAVS